MGMAAHRYYNIQLDIVEFVDMLRLVIGNIDTRFSHNLYGIRIESVRFDAG